MFRNKTLGIAAAATLGLAAMLGSTSAYALKIFDTAPTDRAGVMAGMDSFTYASETLLSDSGNMTSVTGDSTKYYNVGGTGSLILSLPGDITAVATDNYLVTVTLDGMVFRTALTDTSLASDGSAGTDAAFTRAAGGAAGEKTAVFRKDQVGVIDGDSILTLTAQFAVSAGGGSATVTLANQTLGALPGFSGTKTHGPAKVINVASALRETPAASNLTATVDSGFKKFALGENTDDTPVVVGSLGSITLGINGHRIATNDDGDPVDGLEDILMTGQTGAGAANSSVSFMGDFSFAEKVFMYVEDATDAEQNCAAAAAADPAPTDIRMMEGTGDAAVVTNTTKPVNIDPTPTDGADEDAFTTTIHLCIQVQGDDTDDMEARRIPQTDAYTVMGSYGKLQDAALGVMGLQRTLGKISRDGTTVHIPYLTTYAGYNQRIVMSNRGAVAADYEIEFRSEEGVTAMGTDMATGTLAAGSTVTMRAMDLVTLEGGSRTAATIILEGKPGDIDVTSVTVNKETQGTDTVVHHSM